MDWYIFTGQSNTGAARLDEVADPYPEGEEELLSAIPNSIISNPYIDNTYYNLKTERSLPILICKNTGQSGTGTPNPANMFGPEVSFGYTMSPVRILKVGLNNQGINGFISVTGNFNWKLFIYRAMQQAYMSGVTLDLKALIMIHGESDATTLANANAYGTNFGTFLDNFETHYTAMCTKLGFTDRTATYKKILFEMKAAATYKAELEAAKVTFCASEPNAIYWQVDEYDLKWDNLHYSGESCIQIGRDLAEYFTNNNLPEWFA